MSVIPLLNTPSALLRYVAPAAVAGCRLVSTSAVARQQARAAKRSSDDADEFAKTPLRARVLSEEARQVADLVGAAQEANTCLPLQLQPALQPLASICLHCRNTA